MHTRNLHLRASVALRARKCLVGSHARQLDSRTFCPYSNEADAVALVNKVEGDSCKQLLLVLKNVADLHAPWISSGKLIYHLVYVDFYVPVNVEESRSGETRIAH